MLALDLDAFAVAAGWADLPAELRALSLQDTAKDPKFPGAILPRAVTRGEIFWYALAPTAQTWRRLRPLLLAYAGPTVTAFTGQPTALRFDDPAEMLLAGAGAFSAARLTPARGREDLAARALARLVASVARSPADAGLPPPPTSTLLARLDMCLAAGDRAGAARTVSVLRDEWRLDVINLRFVEVRVATAFREWPELCAQPWFRELCRVPKPSSIAHALLEAVWHTYLEPLASDADQLRERYAGELRAVCEDLLAESALSSEIALALRVLGGDVEILPEPRTSVAEHSAAQSHGWARWAVAAKSAARKDTSSAAREAAAEQPASSIRNVAEAKLIAVHLEEVALLPDGPECLRAVLPTLVRWLLDDDLFPRSIMRPLYEATLTIFTLLDDRGPATRGAMLEVLDALLSLELPAEAYRQHLRDAEAFLSAEAGTSTVYWLLDLSERLLRAPSPDGTARLALLNQILSSLQPLLTTLSVPQRAAYKRVAAVANWPLLDLDPAPSAAGKAEPEQFLGRVVALYTLTESAGRQAKEALEDAFPGVRVELSSDHVCTPRLRSLAREADLFVLAAASAKHAATDCVQRHRPASLPVAYASGRGASSIVRAVEDGVADWYRR
jgi:hypothetical protein